LADGWCQHTILVQESTIENLKIIAWPERVPLKMAIQDALNQYVEQRADVLSQVKSILFSDDLRVSYREYLEVP
jgi:hypothetical protein